MDKTVEDIIRIEGTALARARNIHDVERVINIMKKAAIIQTERIESIILLIRGQKVILDRDLAQLYGVTTGNLNKAVKRNIDRFPDDFMF